MESEKKNKKTKVKTEKDNWNFFPLFLGGGLRYNGPILVPGIQHNDSIYV